MKVLFAVADLIFVATLIQIQVSDSFQFESFQFELVGEEMNNSSFQIFQSVSGNNSRASVVAGCGRTHWHEVSL